VPHPTTQSPLKYGYQKIYASLMIKDDQRVIGGGTSMTSVSSWVTGDRCVVGAVTGNSSIAG
jgi:hypothetical protein